MRTANRFLGLMRSGVVYYGNPYRVRGLRRIYRQFVGPDSLCFDVGSHIGNRVACWRYLGARVVAIEPHEDCARLLRWLYGNDAGVTVIEAGLGRSKGSATLLVDERNPTLSTLSPEWALAIAGSERFSGIRFEAQSLVSITTLDDLIETHGLPDFVKIDVEGSEHEVLAGLSRAVPALSFECLPEAKGAALKCIDHLEQLGAYEYNYSRGESHRLNAPKWLGAAGARRFIAGLEARMGSGDIYARSRG